ncbi:glutathione S-transferase [Rhizobium sp. Root274]|uniref:glutathione S-transferase family protein n=1 Tax=unclassified Rhizobium TaxID=2613769 RepID=UPI0007124E81|nr:MULTISPECIES: glutathione S-transferase family protein [unclassified Rhizobium]KQW27408.1 glutathione S-transferase [Rhizobium sp. Root1240]KRD27643.1 glutathione S-transferase [Rhizobium sp. Root274]
METERPQLYGANHSVYVRIARLALQEKGVAYDLVPVDIFAEDGVPAAHRQRHPFGKIPAFEHGDFRLYETGAITRYVDEAFDGPALQPVEAKTRARMNQIISIADGYVYPQMVWGLYVECIEKSKREEAPDEARVENARGVARITLDVLAGMLSEQRWMCGDTLTLADLYLAPMIDYALEVPELRQMLVEHRKLGDWWQRVTALESFRETQSSS